MPRWLRYAWALPTTLVGVVAFVLTLASGGRGRVFDGCLEIDGGFATWLLRRLGAAAMTLGHVVLAVDTLAHDLSRAHERVHVRQVERWGPLFLPAYGLASLLAWRRGWHYYYDNRFEREAYGRPRPRRSGSRSMIR